MSCHALMAEFGDAQALLMAARACARSYRDVDAYAPFPVEGLAQAIGFRPDRTSLVTLLGGIAGGAATYLLQWYSAVVDYPIDSGGRPLHSWPAFIPATFELTILGAAIGTFLALLALNGLPRLHHPIFEAQDFDLASRNRFFLAVRASDPRFDAARTRRDLEALHALKVVEVPA